MARTPSSMVPLGTPMPAFSLPDGSGTLHTEASVAGPAGTLVVFMCNHCPFVIHVAQELGTLGDAFPARGIGIVGINSNDIANYPDDHPSLMGAFAKRFGISFPYVFDASQKVARAFGATCTPDFFLYDSAGELAYRGQLDGSRPGDGTAVTGKDLRRALEAVAAGQQVPEPQLPSIGCNIKWKSCSTCCGDSP